MQSIEYGQSFILNNSMYIVWKGVRVLSFAWLIMAAGFLIINAVFSYQTKYIPEDLLATLKYQVYVIPFFFAANFLVGYGFKLGYKQ